MRGDHTDEPNAPSLSDRNRDRECGGNATNSAVRQNLYLQTDTPCA